LAGYRVNGQLATIVRSNYISYINLQTRELHIQTTTFKNLVLKKQVSNHFIGAIQCKDLSYINPKSNIKVGDKFIAISNNFHLEKSSIMYDEVPFRLFTDSKELLKQYLFKVNSDKTKIISTVDIKREIYNEINSNFEKDIKYISNHSSYLLK